ncbi:hypothetical protein IB238_09020 [Rhizobium sp. ARZ01]|uniref:hypothetical protein n=1 Tax=Rhizobium sp. ARZ01 TaxID=2769313 RepID=UPI001781C22E|nr:hypothetical protein [Rhizobium sp. ARZ01]MBD9372761.1 hypothetical protein [Rhizobium sp. ARZ01]
MSPVLFAAAFAAVTAQPTVEELQADFETARPCYALIDGREVWEGKKAFFISSYTKEAAELDPDLVGADAVLRDDNSLDVIGEFEAACTD